MRTPLACNILIRRLELDDPPLSATDEALVEKRLAEHHADPVSSLPLEELKNRLRSRLEPHDMDIRCATPGEERRS